jgi:drug/metabolite transporter (DMT)-like permease
LGTRGSVRNPFLRDLSWIFGLRPAARSERPGRDSSGDNPVLDCATRNCCYGRQQAEYQTVVVTRAGFLGVAIIVLSDSDFASARSNLGDLLLLVVAAASWALGSILSKRWSPPDEAAAYSGMELMTGGIVLLIASTLLGEPASFEPAAVLAAALGAWVYLTVAGTIVTFAAYIWLLTRVSPTLVATYTFVNPVVAVLLGWAVLGERFGGMMAIGAVLVIGSVIRLLWPGQVAKQATSAPHGVHGMVRR